MAVDIEPTPSGHGYWVIDDRGTVFAQGDAVHHGSQPSARLRAGESVTSLAATRSGRGYWIFSFGDARFFGSMGGVRLNKPVQSLVPDPDGAGYWLVASDGGVFSFEAGFRGSLGDKTLNRPVTGMVPYGNGYLMVGEDGGIFNFSDLPFSGSLGANPPADPVTSVAALGSSH
ncbi:MAG: hypothetical protein ACRD0O_16525 [Acidimicrobiia bacterium]